MHQIDNYFMIIQTRNEVQQLAYIGLYIEEDGLKWWKSNKHRFNAREEFKDAISKYYGDYYKPNRAFNEINDLKQTGAVQKYLNDIDGLNVSAKMTNHHLIYMVVNGITSRLCQAVAQCKDLRSGPYKWKEKLLHIDFITTESQKKEQDNRSKG